jgi:hypothetical protein
MCFRETLTAELSFGDFCESELFFDAYLRADASVLRERTVTGSFLRKEFSRERLTSYLPVDDSVPALKAQADRDFLLAHGTRFDEAVCLSDDCEIASRLGRGGDRGPSGRLLFAPVARLREEEIPTLTPANWGRMRVADSVIELRRVFAVGAEDVASLVARPVKRQSLDDDHALRLATWWTAYACRRGPLVDSINLRKLRLVGEARGEQGAADLEVALKTLLALAWRLQGGAIENAAARYDEHRDDPSAIDWGALKALIGADVVALEAAIVAVREALV